MDSSIDPKHWCFPKAIKKQKCDEIISLCLKQPKIKARVEDSKIELSARNCHISWISNKFIYDILNPFIHAANKNAGWNFQWDWNEQSQFTVYNKNQFYGWHNDYGNFKEDKDKNFKNKIRKLSLTLQLTEPSKYEGGDFQFKWFDGHKVKKVTAKDAKELGTIIIFPSFIWHQITPITKGTRQSLVNWSLGKPFI